MYPDFKELLSVLNFHNVKYLIVGGYAVSFHAQPRATKDIDILVKADAGNSNAVYSALTKFGAPIEGLTNSEFNRARLVFPHGPRTRCRGYPLGNPRR